MDIPGILIVIGMSYNKTNNQQGYIALISIIIISAVTLLLAISANLFGISEAQMGLRKSQGSEAFYLANLCAEDALMKLKDNLNYSGNESLTIGDGSCEILFLEGTGNKDRIIKTTGEIYGLVRKIKIDIDLVHPIMEIRSWEEVTGF